MRGDGAAAAGPGARARVAEAAKPARSWEARPYAGQVDGAGGRRRRPLCGVPQDPRGQQPDVVFTHWPIDNHADHRAISMLVYDAWLRMGSGSPSTITRSPAARTPCSRADPLRQHHGDRAAEAAGLLRARQPDPDRYLRAAGTGARLRGIERGGPPGGGLHPPRPEPRLQSATDIIAGWLPLKGV